MANQLYIPDLNPIRFYEEGSTPLPQYFTKHFEDYPFEEQLQHPVTEKVQYYQKWQNDDIIRLQFESNFSNISLVVVDRDDVEIITLNAIQVRAHFKLIGFYIYEIDVALTNLQEGLYRLRLKLPNDTTMISEWQFIRSKWPNTILHEYKNSRELGDIIFQTGYSPSIRVEATIGRLLPGSREQYYEDQPGNPVILSAKPHRAFNIIYGDSRGLPDWMVDKIHLVWCCNDVRLDGKSFAKTGDSKPTFNEEDNYPMRGFSMVIREGINRGSKIVDPGVDTGKKIVILSPVESIVFGDVSQGGSSNVIVIQSIE